MAAVAAAAAAAVWSTTRSNPKGPLFSTQISADYGVPGRRETTDIGDITFGNSGSTAARLTSIDPVSPTPGLIVTFEVVKTADPILGVGYGPYHVAGLRSPAGFVVAPSGTRESIEVVALLHPDHYTPGRYTSLGLDVHYHVGSRAYTLFIDEGMTTCYRVPVSTCHARIPVTPTS